MSAPEEQPTQPLDPDSTPQEEPMTTNGNDTAETPTAPEPATDGPERTAPTAPAAQAAPTAEAAPTTTALAPRRGMRVGTIVWGLVLAALGAGLLAWAIGVTFDVELAFIILVAASGVLLLVGSVATTLRRRR